MFAEIFKDNSDVAQGQAGVVVYLHHRSRNDPRAVHDDGWRLPEPRENNKTGRRNFLLTQEIGTSCAATQSNHLSYFTDRPTWHMLATQGYFVFRSSITHPQTRFQPIPSSPQQVQTAVVLQERGS